MYYGRVTIEIIQNETFSGMTVTHSILEIVL